MTDESYYDGDTLPDVPAEYEDAVEAAHDREREQELLDEQRAAELDPHYYDFTPGYATEMDFMNANEADDYRDEFEADIDF